MLITNDIRDFLELSRIRNIVETAKQLSITPTVLMRRVRRMEKELACDLLKRSGDEIALTEYGDLILPYAQLMCSLEDSCFSHLATAEEEKYKLRVGYSNPIIKHPIQDFLFKFQRENRFVDSFISTDNSQRLKEQVRSGDCDIAFVLSDPAAERDPSLSSLPVMYNQISVVLPVGHPLSKYGRLNLGQLRDERILLPPAGTPVNSVFTAICGEAGFAPNIIYTSYNVADIVDLVAKEYGVGIISSPNAGIQKSLKVVFVNSSLSNPLLTELIYRRDNLSPAVFYFLTSITPHIGLQAGLM